MSLLHGLDRWTLYAPNPPSCDSRSAEERPVRGFLKEAGQEELLVPERLGLRQSIRGRCAHSGTVPSSVTPVASEAWGRMNCSSRYHTGYRRCFRVLIFIERRAGRTVLYFADITDELEPGCTEDVRQI